MATAWPQLFLDWSISEKLRGTFIEGLGSFLYRDGEGLPTLHTGFKLHGTVRPDAYRRLNQTSNSCQEALLFASSSSLARDTN